jgi:hypothetical protein
MPKAEKTPRVATIAPIDNMLIGAILVTGLMAGLKSHSELLLFTPVMALLVRVAGKQAYRSSETELPIIADFPQHIGRAVDKAIGRIPPGEPRRLLGGVVRSARPLFVMKSSAFDASKDDEARGQAGELIVAACDTAIELSQLDDMLEVHTAPGSGATPSDMSLLIRLSSARDLLVTRLRDASLALDELYASGVVRGTPASDRVAELVAELKADAGARDSAKQELDQLLRPNNPS